MSQKNQELRKNADVVFRKIMEKDGGLAQRLSDEYIIFADVYERLLEDYMFFIMMGEEESQFTSEEILEGMKEYRDHIKNFIVGWNASPITTMSSEVNKLISIHKEITENMNVYIKDLR
jgi:hypothetical protein